MIVSMIFQPFRLLHIRTMDQGGSEARARTAKMVVDGGSTGKNLSVVSTKGIQSVCSHYVFLPIEQSLSWGMLG
jgi:hypothetical protein